MYSIYAVLWGLRCLLMQYSLSEIVHVNVTLESKRSLDLYYNYILVHLYTYIDIQYMHSISDISNDNPTAN